MRARVLLAAIGLVWSGLTGAQEEDVLGWDGEVSLGMVAARGNAETTTINAQGAFVHEGVHWRRKFDAEYLNASDDSGTTAERFVAQASSNYKLSGDAYFVVLNVRYVKDRFAGLQQRVSESAGYGRRFRWERARLDAEVGLGGRHTEFVDGTRQDELIGRLAADYTWQFSETGEFAQTLLAEIGEENVHSEAETALKLRLNGRLALRVSFRLIDDSDVPPDTKRTDTITGVNLVYDLRL